MVDCVCVCVRACMRARERECVRARVCVVSFRQHCLMVLGTDLTIQQLLERRTQRLTDPLTSA